MEVIAHHDGRMDQPGPFFGGFYQAGLKSRLRQVGAKDVRPIVTPIDHMVAGPRKFQTQLAGHASMIATRPPAPTGPAWHSPPALQDQLLQPDPVELPRARWTATRPLTRTIT